MSKKRATVNLPLSHLIKNIQSESTIVSREIAVIKKTGQKEVDLQIALYWGGNKGRMIQISQDFGDRDGIGYIQLTLPDAYNLVIELTKAIKEISRQKTKSLEKEIEKDTLLKDIICQEIVDCERFISEVQTMERPLRLLNGGTNNGK